MIIISDTGPLISLSLIDQLGLLEKIYTQFYIPEKVWEEVKPHLLNQNRFTDLHFLQQHVKKITRPILSNAIELEFIDEGEAESIVLLREMHADALLIDDMAGTLYAEKMGIACFGVLRVLIEAKKLLLIGNLRPYLIIFLEHKRFFSKKVFNDVLLEMNEPPL